MTLVRRFNNVQPSMANIFDNFFGGEYFANPIFEGQKTMPAVNIRENEDGYLIEVAAPGMKKEDFKVEVNNNVLTISCEQDSKKDESEKGYTRREFSYTAFNRSFSIPSNEVDDSKINATYNDGILQITLLKREELKPKPARMIAIN